METVKGYKILACKLLACDLVEQATLQSYKIYNALLRKLWVDFSIFIGSLGDTHADLVDYGNII